MITLVIPRSWWDSALPETKAAVRSAADEELSERRFRMPATRTTPLLALLLKDRRQARPARVVVERLERKSRRSPDPGTAKVVRRRKREEHDDA